MEKTEQIRVLKSLMAHLDNGTNVDAGGIRKNPVSAYTCPDIARAEWETFFRNTPQVVGMSGDLPNPGTFFTRNDFGVPLLAVRDKQGCFRAFANVCRHRGAIVETQARGKKSRFSCPFHGWTYNARGVLIGLPKGDHFGQVDKACLGLVALPAEERYGFLWVHPQPGGTLDVDNLLSGLAPEFEAWSFQDMVLTGEDTYETPMNWKLAIDTFGETYHFSTLHRDTLFATFYGNVQEYDTYGRNHRMALCLRAIDTLRDTPEETWRITQGAFPVYYLFPNIQVNVATGGVILVRVYPVPGEPAQSVSRISFYATPELVAEDPVMIHQRHKGFAGIIRDEDYAAAAASQIGAQSGIQDAFTFGRNEPALHHYHNTYREALGMEPLPLIKAS